MDFKDKVRGVIKLTDLSDYLKVSRPTLYKLLEYYEGNEFDKIERKQLELFNYINDTPNLSKKQVMNFIVQNQIIQSEENNSLSSFIFKYEYTGSIDEDKDELIRNIIISKNLGSLISLINRYCFLSQKEELNSSEAEEILIVNYIKDLASKKENLPGEIIDNYRNKKGGK